jgi:chromosome segregation ATPase
MADEKSTVLGIRIDTEERKRFDDFVNEEGKNNKDFLNTLLNLYELNKGKVKNINLVGDIETLEGYTNKIQQAFVNIIDKLESQKGDIEDNSQNNLQIYKEKVNSLENELEAIKLVNSIKEEKVKGLTEDYATVKLQNNQLQENLQDKLTIIKEYQGKNDTLTGILEEYKQYKVDVEEYKKSFIDAQSKNNELNESLKDKDFTVNILNKDIEKLKEDHEKSINELTNGQEQLQNKHISDIEQLEDKASIKMDKALIELQKVQQEQLSQEQTKHNAEIETYQSKYKSLLEELENVRTTPKVKKESVAAKNKLISSK